MLLDLVKAVEFDEEVKKFKVNFEHMVLANNPEMWKQLFGDEQQRMENETEFYRPSSQAEFEEMMQAFRNPPAYSKKPS